MFDAAPATSGGEQPDAAEYPTIDVALARPGPGTALLTVSGEVDTVTAPQLEAGLHRLLDGSDTVLAVDLGEVTFLASSGLAALIRAAHSATASGRRLRLVVHGRPVLRPLKITGTDQLFDLHPDRETALAPGPPD